MALQAGYREPWDGGTRPSTHFSTFLLVSLYRRPYVNLGENGPYAEYNPQLQVNQEPLS